MEIDFVLATYVYLIANLPKRPEIILESQALALMDQERDFHKSLSLWLRHLVLAEALSPEAYQGSGQYYSPQAWLWKARLELTGAVYSRSGNLALRQFSSPAELWFAWISAVAQENFDKNGLTGEPEVCSKREHYKLVMKFCSLLEKRELEPEDFTEISSPGSLIFAEAQALAKQDLGFRHKELRDFIKEWRYRAKQIKHCKDLQHRCLMPDGSIFTTGKHLESPTRNVTISLQKMLTLSQRMSFRWVKV